MKENPYAKILDSMSAKDLADPILVSISNNISEAVNLFENENTHGAAAAIGRAQIAMAQFMEIWKEITK